ncbi:MAG: hypothetical protein EOP59_11100 [Sphingomonadales bacterium]|nr:MAG: hypothetical protein EOP59_11100 [Sphingomonadales bacterium]
MRIAAIGLTVTLAACGGGVDVPQTENMAAQGIPAARTAAVECGTKPDFVPVYGDAEIGLCTAGAGPQPGHESGTIVYTTAAEPRIVLGWSREQANAAGLGQRLSTETLYSAGEAAQRNLTVEVVPDSVGAKVTVKWGRDR